MEVKLTKKDGKVSMEKPFGYLCSLLRNGEYILKITRKKSPRSLPQNSLMWMWFKCLEDQTGQPKEDWHDYYCAKFLARPVLIGFKTFMKPGRTSTLTKEQFAEFLNKVQVDASTEWGCNLPLPSDQFFSAFVDEYGDRY